MDRLNDILAGTFEGASVVIKDHVLGYRRKNDLFVLLVEVFGSYDSGGAHSWSRSGQRTGSVGKSAVGIAAARQDSTRLGLPWSAHGRDTRRRR